MLLDIINSRENNSILHSKCFLLFSTSGPNTGFVANGAHLPLAPGAEGAVVAAKSQQGAASFSAAQQGHGGASNSWSAASSARSPPVPATATNFVLHKYLPPDSSQKYGYIFDTRA